MRSKRVKGVFHFPNDAIPPRTLSITSYFLNAQPKAKLNVICAASMVLVNIIGYGRPPPCFLVSIDTHTSIASVINKVGTAFILSNSRNSHGDAHISRI